MRHLLLLFVLFISRIQFGFCSKTAANSNVSCIGIERLALLKFKEGVIDKSNRLASWAGEDCCAWEGVGCSNRTGNVEKLDLRNRIVYDFIRYAYEANYSAQFDNNRLGGQINPSLINLVNLLYLDLSMNNFSGIPIPTFFGSFKYLRYLNLSMAGFVGAIPHRLGNLSNLEHLDLNGGYRYNNLVSKSLWWIPQLSSLKSLDLSGVYLGGIQDWLHEINMLPSLLSLKLAGCGLTSISPLSHVNVTSLASLDLSSNLFSSAFPLGLFNLSSLKDLHFHLNDLQGPIPNMLEQLTSLTVLDLSANVLNASLPSSLCKLRSLVSLDLSDNAFQGNIPLCLGNLTSLAIFRLEQNRFRGTIPPEIGHLGQLTELSFAYNAIEGTISSKLGQLMQLERFDVSHNQFNGTVPSSLGQLGKLKVYDISYNSLVGVLSEVHFMELKQLEVLSIASNFLALNVSFQWVPPFQLLEIYMDSVQVGPRFPPWLVTQKNVRRLSMSNASISDTLPNWFEVLYSRVGYLVLSYNQISGKPPEFENANCTDRYIVLGSNKFQGPLKSFPPDTLALDLSNNFLFGEIFLPHGNMTNLSLEYLFLNDNYLTGSIPDYLCNMQSLYAIDLSNNQLSGRLPLCLGNLRGLMTLNLANNNLHGQIPRSLGNLAALQFLHLNENRFIGQLPSTLQALKYLRILDLGDNQLEETIPEWIGKELSKLVFLRLESNHFFGDMPPHLCQLSALQVLNLGQNQLTGNIPLCFGSFSAILSDTASSALSPMSSGHVWDHIEELSNSMKGIELVYSTNLKYLKSIILSENNLAGEIPKELMDLKDLRSLNLSRNHLSGRIPEKIGNLEQLESLDLSMNELSGPIPPSLATIYSLSYLNLSFNKLSGRIPSGNQIQTLDDQSIYEGNSALCGKPLPTNCPDDKSLKGNGVTLDHEGGRESNSSWFLAGMAPGFTTGFLGICCILHFKKSWRYAHFQFVENVYDRVRMVIAVKASQLCRKFH